jgi:hypothetical protein
MQRTGFDDGLAGASTMTRTHFDEQAAGTGDSYRALLAVSGAIVSYRELTGRLQQALRFAPRLPTVG